MNPPPPAPRAHYRTPTIIAAQGYFCFICSPARPASPGVTLKPIQTSYISEMLRLQPPQIGRFPLPGKKGIRSVMATSLCRGKIALPPPQAWPCSQDWRGPSASLWGRGGGWGHTGYSCLETVSWRECLQCPLPGHPPPLPSPRHLAQPQLCPLSGSKALISGCSHSSSLTSRAPLPPSPGFQDTQMVRGNQDSRKKAIPQFPAPPRNRLPPLHRTSLQAGAAAGIRGRLASYCKHS